MLLIDIIYYNLIKDQNRQNINLSARALLHVLSHVLATYLSFNT